MAVKGFRLNDRATKEKMPPFTYFVDTETREEENGDLTLICACYEIWKTDEYGLPEYPVRAGEYFDESEFYRIARSYLPCRIVAHNWQFDAAVLRIGSRDNMNRYSYDIDIVKSILPSGGGFAPFFLRLNFNDLGHAELVCNTNFYKMPLRKIGESLGVEKLTMPETTDMDNMLTYCRRDVLILRRSYFALHKLTQEIADTTPGITSAMAAKRVFQNAYYEKNKVVQGTQHIPRINAAERQAYHGGRTDTFWKGKPASDDTIIKYDVNSLYPSCMLGNIPIKFLQTVRGKYLERYIGNADTMVMADVEIHIPPESHYGFLGLEGIKDESGQLIFPVGRYRSWIWQPLLEIALAEGYIEKVFDVALYDVEPIFNRYITSLYELRQKYKSENNSAFELLCKLLMNALYGKFAQREPDKWQYVDPESLEYIVMAESDNGDMRRFAETFDGVEKEYWQQGVNLYASQISAVMPLSRQAVASVAGYITAMGRSVLWNAMAATLDNGGVLYMCDTDSIVTNMALPREFLSETELGKWKNEKTTPGESCYFFAPKHYIMANEIKLKGIRNPRIGDSRHDQTVFPKFTTDLLSHSRDRRDRLESGGKIAYIVKEPTGLNLKRIEIGESRPTMPIVVGY